MRLSILVLALNFLSSFSFAQVGSCQNLFMQNNDARIESSEILKPLTKTLSGAKSVTTFGIHAMDEKFLSWLEPIYKETGGCAPTDWPFRLGKKYPGLWTAFNPNKASLDTIDGDPATFVYPGGRKAVVLKLELDQNQKVLWLNDYDVSDAVKAELAALKIKDAGTSEQWSTWLHGRKLLIQLAAEAGYSGLYLGLSNELIILDSTYIVSIEKYDSTVKQYVPLKK